MDFPGFVTDVTPTPDVRKNRGDENSVWLDEYGVECQHVIIDELGDSKFNAYQLPVYLLAIHLMNLTKK